ncbi:hypothetical protein EVAR_90108_1 [Eumeta japonica]|uniref:Uncharacterized protein n=1 Tax=Eumeta variegata TaxID=151549 RepID=A0A4C1X286_EUMVA|nr:hypothetical protein EVAR_90108_1 [Eumeta japonica]
MLFYTVVKLTGRDFNACIKPPAWKEAEVIGIHKPGNHATSCQLQTDQPPGGMSALTRQDVLSEQEFLKAPPFLLCCTRVQTMYRDRRRLASNSRYSRTIPRLLRK